MQLDGYKLDHRRQAPENTALVFANMTPRGSRVEGTKKVVFFGLQYFLKEYVIKNWNETFFDRPVEEVVRKYNRSVKNYVGPNDIGEDHIRELHALGYLPLEFWALPEGSEVNLRVPMYVCWNTHPDTIPSTVFSWIVNSLETIASCTIWMPTTSATTALMYRKLLDLWCSKTNPEMSAFVPWQGHDFSFRGHSSRESAIISGAGHLLSFTGSDTYPCIDFFEEYYGADGDKELIAGTIPATEHSVMCLGGLEDEVKTFSRLMDIYVKGPFAVVSDTWNLWNVVDPVNGILARLKDKIMGRDGKLVVRPDSGDPVDIICGTARVITHEDGAWELHSVWKKAPKCQTESGKKYIWVYDSGADEYGKLFRNLEDENLESGFTLNLEPSKSVPLHVKGVIQCLWEGFGGTTTSTGYMQLDSHVGAIYGDSITLERAEQICKRLEALGFASTNVVYGIGSFTYQGAITKDAIVTRDTHGFAVKTTYGELLYEDGTVTGKEIFKDPITDDGLKKSAKGLIAVYQNPITGDFSAKDQATWDEVRNCAFVQVFKDGEMTKEWNLAEIRARLASSRPS
jgi:nicotinamide phosphoribosyltransferase